MKGRLIVIEGTDGSGKATQTALLSRRLSEEGFSHRCLAFPCYDRPSSALVRQYLAGDFGTGPDDVNAYAAAAFYAVDRFASWAQDWRGDYQAGGLFLADRYTTANAVHQAAKLPEAERPAFFQWLTDLEHRRFGLPQPDLVLYLDMPVDLSESLLQARSEQTGTAEDIHEQNTAYLRRCRSCGQAAAAWYGWTVLPCVRSGCLRTPQDIHEELYARVRCLLERDFPE